MHRSCLLECRKISYVTARPPHGGLFIEDEQMVLEDAMPDDLLVRILIRAETLDSIVI